MRLIFIAFASPNNSDSFYVIGVFSEKFPVVETTSQLTLHFAELQISFCGKEIEKCPSKNLYTS